jgi:hypothetical protein
MGQAWPRQGSSAPLHQHEQSGSHATVPAELERNIDSLPMRADWNSVLIFLTARGSGQCFPQCDFQEAETWFRGDLQTTTAWLSAQFSGESLWQAEQFLNAIQIDSEFRALLPYILEEHGPGSRASVMKDPATASSRAAKRETVGFRPLACNEERDAIDTILAKAAGLREEFVTELRLFAQKNAVVDSTDERRNHMSKHFAETITR